MIPIQLTISGFLSYRVPVEIDFTLFDLACISGHNGAGKSSILDAITWALFGQARKRDDSIINNQSETAEVSLTFQYEGNTYRVIRSNSRGKATQLEFQLAYEPGHDSPDTTVSSGSDSDPPSIVGNWKTLSERTMRGTQANIEDTLRLDYETFINAAFFLQGKADQFTQQRPGDRKRILSSILGLEVWETYRARAVEHRKTIEGEMAALDGRLSEINAELAEGESRRARLSQLEIDLERLTQSRIVQGKTLENIRQISVTLAEQRKLVDQLAQQLDATQKRGQDIDTRLAARQDEVANHSQILARTSEIETAYQSWIEAREALARWDEIADQFREQEKRRAGPRLEIESERARLTQELGNLDEQMASLSDLQSSIPELQSALSRHQAQSDHLQAEIENRKALEAELAEAQGTLANAKAENPRLRAEMDDLKTRIDQLKGTEGAACPICGQPLSTGERNNLIDELSTLGKTMGDRFRANRALLSEADHNVSALRTAIASLARLDEKILTERDQANRTQAKIDGIEAQQASWETERAPRREEINHILRELSYAPEARILLAEIDAELKGIGYDAAAHDIARGLERDGRSSEAELRTLDRARAALEPLENEVANLQGQIEQLQVEVSAQQTEYDQAVAHLAAAEAQAPDIHQAQRDYLDIQEQENRLRLEVGAASQKVQVLEDLKTRRSSLEAEREGQAQKVGQYRQLERAFGKDGVPALLIEQALPQIETKANELLERLSDGSMSVRFITQREYKDKKRDDLRETLDIQISDRVGVRDYEMFSGGEAFRVNFAIRLALSEVLAQRAGARLQTLVIDEGFGSQDEMGRQRLIEAINTVKPDFAKILVITHIDSLKDAFPARIEVEKTPRGSLIYIR